MAPALTLVLLCGLGAPGGWGCLQCEPSVRDALDELRTTLLPAHFQASGLRARAQALLLGMEGPFFRDYAVNVFVGKVGVDDLEVAASFVKNQTLNLKVKSLTDEPLLEQLVSLREKAVKELKKGLKSYEAKACDPKTCGLLKEEIWDCLRCQKSSPKCIQKKHCFVDMQPRVALQYGKDSGDSKSRALLGTISVVFLAIFAFAIILISACTYRQNRKLLLQ